MRSCILRRYGLNVKSNAVRHAIVLNSIRVLRERGRVVITKTQELEYLGHVYGHAQVAIQQNKFLDLLYEYLLWSASPIEEIAKHSLGFFLSLQHRQQTVTLDLLEREMVFYMYCQMAIRTLQTPGLFSLKPATLSFSSLFWPYSIRHASEACSLPPVIFSFSFLRP